jgi:hypothetical protein
MIVPWLPCASTPMEGVPDDGVDETYSVPVVATVMPIASVGAAVTVTVTDRLADPPTPVQVTP